MSTLRNLFAWLLMAGFVSGSCWIAIGQANASKPEVDESGRCPTTCRYKKHWGPALDPHLSFIGDSTPPFCPLHSSHPRGARG